MEQKDFHTEQNPLEFKQLVLGLLGKIMNHSIKTYGNDSDAYVVNARSYCMGILTLSDVLLPFFDETMTKKYSEFEKKDKSFRDDRKVTGKRDIKDYKNIHRELFRQLNLLLNRVDYLKSNIYEESSESQ